MFTQQVSVLISRPAKDVFEFIEDARNRPRWDESVDSEELTSPEPIGVGTTVRTTLRSMGRPGGLLRLFQPLIARNTQKNLDHGFARLERLLETGSADVGS